MNAPVLDIADVSSPGLYRDDTWREHFAVMRREDPVHPRRFRDEQVDKPIKTRYDMGPLDAE